MSVTFTIEGNPTGEFIIDCDDKIIARAASYDAILVERAAHMLVCDDCQHYGCYTTPVMDVTDEFDVDVSSANGRLLLTILGVASEDLTGMLDGADLLGRVLLAMAEDRDDTGVPAQDQTVPGSARWIDCGVRPGYYADRFSALHALAAEAARLGRPVIWS